jgi:hypothetical protein
MESSDLDDCDLRASARPRHLGVGGSGSYYPRADLYNEKQDYCVSPKPNGTEPKNKGTKPKIRVQEISEQGFGLD